MPIPGLSADKCAQRNHLAARRDGVNAVPMRFLKGADVQHFLAQSASNRGGSGKLPASDAEALALINTQRGENAEPLTEDQVYLHYIEAANDNFVGDRYLFLDASTLKNIASDAQAGFAFMNSHRTGGLSHQSELPFGRTIGGRFENFTDEDGTTRQRTVVAFYMLAGVKPNGDAGPSTDDLHKMIDAKTVFDVSVGLWGGDAVCDVCGEDLNAYDSEEGYLCPHVPGSTYKMTAAQIEFQKARGVGDGAASYSLCNSHCGEVSAVYDGAVTGAGFRKALAFAKQGGLDEAALEQLQHAYETLVGATSNQPFKTAKHTERPGSPAQVCADKADNQFQSPEGTGSQGGSHGRDSAPQGAKMSVTKLSTALAAALAAVGINVGSDEPTEGTEAALGQGGAAENRVLLSGLSTVPAPSPAPAKLSVEDQARFEKQDADLAKMRADLDAANKRAEDKEAEARFTANSAYIEGKKRDFFLTPAAADKYLELAKSNPDAFDACKPGIEANGVVVALAGSGDNTVPADSVVPGGGSEGNQLEQLAKDYAAKNKVSYGEAFAAVCSENPDLAAAYRAAQSPG